MSDTLTLKQLGEQAKEKAALSDYSISVSRLLAEFRKHVQQELEVKSLAGAQVDAGLFLNDLCEFLGLDDEHRLIAVGQAVFEYVGDPLPLRKGGRSPH